MSFDVRERRREERESVQMTLWIGRPGGEPDEPLSVDNVSLGGLAFRSRKQWAEGDTVQVNVNVDRPLDLEATILRCRETQDGFRFPWQKREDTRVYDIGVEFADTEDEKRRQVVDQIFRCDAYQRGARQLLR